MPGHARLWQEVQPGDFIDGYAVQSPLSPRAAADLGLTLPNWGQALLNWGQALLKLRNRIVAPLGLKTGVSDQGADAIFPVVHKDARELILGTNDRHLDFRICVMQEAGRIHMATWVHRNNLLGRFYLMAVMPFHVLIVRDSMRRIARHSAPIASGPRGQ
ncbi:DUF2867 domain-containing protein [Phaeobacter sp. QD34_3]|uniref:DUF2867 domain-containing protein n=1 Tax=unclassified Phaeobacter TaxID=2621772 RepID=UPI00237F7C66|nr:MULTISPECIES: DUF2867 domain-containing protein [unclassified Phaeobacter]MDE4133766.1 DUF2867 domain-containing protein [Phaeobacter sp. QD34_3]MDE4137301.1 DUF2867 domain-containing protein [Phaeobacter sp. QD34_24]